MHLERKNYTQLGEPVGPYVHAVQYQGVLYLSGLTAFGTSAQDGDLAAQAKAIFEQIDQIARAEQSGLENIIKVTMFITDFSEIAALRTTLFEIYGPELPASSLVQVSRLFAPELKIEIEAMLAVER